MKPRKDANGGGNGLGVNEEGASYTLTGVDRHGVAYCADGGEVAATITRQISEQSGQDNRANAVVQCYENHAQDSRIQGPIDIAPTQGSSNANSAGVSGNNPIVVNIQGLDGYSQQLTGEVASTCRAKADTDLLPLIVSTNSNGEDVAPTLDHNTGATNGICAQNDNRGGYVVTRLKGDK